MERDIILSVLICSLEDRAPQLARMMEELRVQIGDLPVEVVTEVDAGEMTVGAKRNKLLRRAQGEYACFVDDDDTINHEYIPLIMKALESKPDCVGIEGVITVKDKAQIFRHSCEFAGWYTAEDGYYRTPNHLNPVKREIALKIGFPEKNTGEDFQYSVGIRRFLKREEYIDGPIYFYTPTVHIGRDI